MEDRGQEPIDRPVWPWTCSGEWPRRRAVGISRTTTAAMAASILPNPLQRTWVIENKTLVIVVATSLPLRPWGIGDDEEIQRYQI